MTALPPTQTEIGLSRAWGWGALLHQLEDAARSMHVPAAVHARLAACERSLEVAVPVTMDDGRVVTFTGWRVQHVTARGPGYGGTRYHATVGADELRGLAAAMTYRAALFDLPIGGAKGGLRCDPMAVSRHELELITRRYASRIGVLLGDRDVPIRDMDTDAETLEWLLDSVDIPAREPPAMTSSLLVSTRRYDVNFISSIANGVVHVVREFLLRAPVAGDRCRVIVHGFGRLGRPLVFLLAAAGMRIVGVSDGTLAVVNEGGLDARELARHFEEAGTVGGYRGGQEMTASDVLSIPTDLFVVASAEGSIDAGAATRLDAGAVIEATTFATHPEADLILEDRGITVVPDILANGGGATASFARLSQGLHRRTAPERVVADHLGKRVAAVFGEVWDAAQSERLALRPAAFQAALRRLIPEVAASEGAQPYSR